MLATEASLPFPKWQTIHLIKLIWSTKFASRFTAMCRSLPRLSSLKKTCQFWSMPTWHRLVYFIRLLAVLRCSTHCTQCLLTKKRKEKDNSAGVCTLPALSRVLLGRQEPLMVPVYSLFFPAWWGPWVPSAAQLAMNENCERRALITQSICTRAHMYIRLLLFICTHVPSSWPLPLRNGGRSTLTRVKALITQCRNTLLQ